jgi:hypothetical protein
MWGRSAAVAAAVAVLACAVAAPGRAAAAGVSAAGDAGATDSAVPVAASFIAEGPDLFPVVCVMFSWPGHPQDRVGCVAHLGYVAQVLRTGHVDLCTPNQPMCRVEFNERPTTARYGPGKVVDVGPYRCEVLKVAVRCLVRSTGSGFRINNHEAVRVAAGPPKKSAAPKPVFGRTAALKTVSGTVLVKAPGAAAFVPLGALTSVPLGTTVDTTAGTVQLTAAADRRGHVQTGRFYEGVFRLTQTTARSPLQGGRKVGVTVLTLAGPAPEGCAAAASVRALGARTYRRLWGNAHGNFRTRGRYASATVRGTQWLTEDTCQGTLVKVARGVVAVEELRTHRTTLVRAGHSVLTGAKPPGATGAIYFLPGFLNAVNAGSERAVEPPLLALFADGSWVLEGLKWTGWGTPVAHATGISSASNGIPNQAEGTRIKTPAEAMLSNPGAFFGHRIYRCIHVFVQPPANFGGNRCLKRTGSLYLYE